MTNPDTQLTFALLATRRALKQANEALEHLRLADADEHDMDRALEVAAGLCILENNLYEAGRQRQSRRLFPESV